MTGTGKDPSPRGGGPSPSEFAGLGIQLIVAILLFLYLGKWVDERLGTSWFQVVGVFLGAGLSFYSMYRKLMAAQARDDAERAARKSARDGESP